MKTKVCSKCGIEKSLNEFSTDNQRKDGLYPQCRLCRKLYQQENKEKRKQYRKVYNQKNKHIHALYIQNYRKNISVRLADSLRTRVRFVLNRNIKFGHTLELLGCSIEELRKHLENQFKPGMTWNNYGTGWYNNGMAEWQIDHIKPLAKFNLIKESEQKKAIHYTNLQPLWAEENWSKSNK